MSITKTKNYNVSPYYDDFDETKNFHRVLFRPSKSVQVRELTQLQTALQVQIDMAGQYNFNDGSRVIGGKVSVNTSYDYIKLTGSTSNLIGYVGTTITGADNGVTALVIGAVAAENSDPDTLFIQYTNSGSNNETTAFVADEEITNSSKTSTISGSGTTPIGQGSLVSIEEGAYFISGTYVYVPASTLVLEKYSNTPSYIIGLSVIESVVTSGEDSSLLDNAAGTPNSSAPGANRYSITTQLIKEPLDISLRTNDDYVVLLKINNGIIQNQVTEKLDTELTDRLARRTFEESGDYVVRPYILDIREHLDNELGNGGYLTAANGGDPLKIAIGVEPSVAYVKGLRVENLATKYVEIDKPRSEVEDVKSDAGVITSIGFGNYVKLDTVLGSPDTVTFTTINLHDAGSAGGNIIGTCRARDLQIVGSETRLFIFDVKMNVSKTFSEVRSLDSANPNFTSDLLNDSPTVFDSGNNGLVFKLPADAIKTLKTLSAHTADYTSRVKITSNAVVSGGSTSFTITGTGASLASDDDVVIVDTAGAQVPVAITSVTGVGGTAITLSSIPAQFDGLEIDGFFNINVSNGSAKTKTLQTGTVDTITYSGSVSTYVLSEVDVIGVTSIVDSSGVDVTDKFIVDNGQRSNYYTNGAVTLKGGEVLPTGDFVVTYNAFRHSSGGGDYFSVDSYPNFAEIPRFEGLELRDCIDFRPTKSRSGASAGSEFSTGSGNSLCRPIQPVGLVSVDITSYLGRVDKLALTTDGEFKIIKGISGLNPKEPENIEDSITLYTIRVNPYVFNETDIIPRMVDNRRYSMRDIGKLEKRINTLEYYTSLSLLEKSATEAQIFDSGTGDLRFKNGFITDAFYGHNVGNPSNRDYACAIDKNNGLLRPKFDERSINLVRKVADSGTCEKHKGGIVTLPIVNTVSEINQPYSTYSQLVNPYSVAVWEGTIKLSPESDEWKEVDRRPDVIIDDNGMFDQFVALSEQNGVLGTVWNEWENNWTGRDLTTTSFTTKTKVTAAEANAARNSGIPVTSSGLIREDRTTITAGTLTGTSSRTGIETYVTSDIETKTLDDKVLEINFIPFMRSRKVYFDAQLLKPNTKVYPFFSGTNISNYSQESAFVEFSDITQVDTYENTVVHPDGSTDLITDASGRVTGSFIIPRNSLLQFKTGTREFKLTDSSVNDDVAATTFASESFFAQGLLETVEKTIVNTKVPRIATREVSRSKAITKRVFERNVETIRYYDPLAQTFVIDTDKGVFVTELDLFFSIKDAAIPISVSIRTVENGIPTQKIVPGTEVVVYPNNIITSADASVATTIDFDFPVHLQASSEYAIVLISNSDIYKVFVAETGGFDLTNTNFRVIKQPYNGVFFTSANASTWSPEQTKDLKFNLKRASFNTSPQSITLVNDEVPSKVLVDNPFKVISDDEAGNVEIRVTHPNHGMYSLSDSTHDVTISGVVGTVNNIPSSTLNGTHSVKRAELDSYVISVSGDATTVGSQFGGNEVRATENQIIDTMHPYIESIEFSNAPIVYSASLTTASSVDTDTTGQSNYGNVVFSEIANNTNTVFDRPYMIASTINETNNNSSSKSFEITATMSNNGLENISPVIDLNRASVIAVQNRINDNTDSKYDTNGTIVEDTETSGTTSAAKYITKQVKLETEADQINIYMSINKPDISQIDVYYKVAQEDETSFDDILWTKSNSTSALPTNNDGVYSDASWSISSSSSSFSSFAVKIVLRSKNSSVVPTVRDFRAIATI